MNDIEWKLAMFIVWLIVGAIILIDGNITWIQYGCIYVCFVWRLFDEWQESKR